MTQIFKGEGSWDNLIWCCEQIATRFDLAQGSHQVISQQNTEMYTNRRHPSHVNLQVRSSETDTTYRWLRGSDFRPVHPQQPHPRKPGPTRTEAMT